MIKPIRSFSKEQWGKAKRTKGVMIRITIRHHDSAAIEVEGVFDQGSVQHDASASAQRILMRLGEGK